MRKLFMQVLLALLLVSVAHADTVTLISQNRYVSASGSAEDSQESANDSENGSAPSFAPYQDAAGVTVFLGGAIGSGTGSQTSSITTTQFRASGSHSANGEGWEELGFGSGDGISHFEVVFEVTGTCGYTISGFLEHFDSGFTNLLLTGSSGTILFLAPGSNATLNVAEVGTLTTGQYTFIVESDGGAFGDFFFYDYASGAYDIQFTFDGAVSSPLASQGDFLTSAPNPFAGETELRWGASRGQRTDVQIVDVRGRLVRTLATNEARVQWDSRDESGRVVPAGIYFARVQTAEGSRSVRLVRLRN